MYLLSDWRRQEQASRLATRSGSGMSSTTIVIIVVVIVVILGLALGFHLLRNCRRKHDNPKYIPTPFFKNLWKKWEPGKTHHLIPNSDVLESHGDAGLSLTGSRASRSSVDITATGAVESGRVPASVIVDRHTSVRSIMTLPAYHLNPLQNEQVLGREGERGGVDVVVEFPEGADEEEASREAEMEALYQVRLARRRENEEREERRRLKREARERGDFVALRELQARSTGQSSRSPVPTVEETRAEHARIKQERQRAISSVSYADLGIARHDGTRLRANSNDSERDGLLGSAASMGSASHHHRGRSASSVISVDTMNTELPSGRLGRSRANSALSDRPDTPLRQVTSRSQAGTPSLEGRAGSSPEMIEDDDIPPSSPPGYENISLDTPNDSLGIEPPPDYSTSTVTVGEPQAGATAMVATVSRPTAVTVDSEGRRTSPNHVGQLILERMPSNSSSASVPVSARAPGGEQLTSAGPRRSLQALTLPSLPSIQIDPASPASRNADGHPEE